MLSSLTRSLLAVLLAAIIATPAAMMSSTPRVASAAKTAAELGIPESNMPPELGASGIEAYVPETGHSVTGYMQDYWRANGGASVYGNPISQPFGASNQLYSQAFERGVFQYSEVWLYSDDAAVRLAPIVIEDYALDRSERRSDGRRNGADRRTAHFPASINSVRAEQVYNEGGSISPFTGYSISGPYAAWYEAHEGWFYLGAPMSEPMRMRGVEGQVYQNGILLNQDGVLNLAPLPREHPERYGIDTTPIEQGMMPVYSEGMFYTTYNPFSVDPTTLTGPKRIEVDRDTQTMRAYQGDVLVLESPVSTGLKPNYTEIGLFHVRIKYESQSMEGFTDSSGEVVSVGTDATQEAGEDGERYSVDDVPHVMYINYEAEALHGAYWHDNFGEPMSHGCINQPLDVAKFMYEFSPLGTPVTVVGEPRPEDTKDDETDEAPGADGNGG